MIKNINNFNFNEKEMISIIYNTNNIENEDLTIVNTEIIIKEIKENYNIEVKDRKYYLVNNLYKMYNYIKDIVEDDITPEMLMELHSIEFYKLNKIYLPGELRGESAGIKGDNDIIFSSPDWIEDDLYIMCDLYNKKRNKFDTMSNEEILDSILYLKKKIIDIHPFEDGNGRLSRAIFQKELAFSGLPMTYFNNWNKDEYHLAMRFAYINNDISKIKEIYLKEIQDYYIDLDWN